MVPLSLPFGLSTTVLATEHNHTPPQTFTALECFWLAGLLITLSMQPSLQRLAASMVAGVAQDQRACYLVPCQLRMLHAL
jgi:hypothetical protein